MSGDQKPYMIIVDNVKFYFNTWEHAILNFILDSQSHSNNKQIDLFKWLPAEGKYILIQSKTND